MYLTDEELCMLEQLTYLDEKVSEAAGIGNNITKLNAKYHVNRSVEAILSVYDETALRKS